MTPTITIDYFGLAISTKAGSSSLFLKIFRSFQNLLVIPELIGNVKKGATEVKVGISVLWFLFHLLLLCQKKFYCNSKFIEGHQNFP